MYLQIVNKKKRRRSENVGKEDDLSPNSQVRSKEKAGHTDQVSLCPN